MTILIEPDRARQVPAQTPTSERRWRARVRAMLVFAVLASALTALGLAPGVAAAAEGECPPGSSGNPDGPDGCVPDATVDAVEEISSAYFQAYEAKLAAEARKAEIQQSLAAANAGLEQLKAAINKTAAARFMGNSVGLVSSIINGEVPSEELLSGASVNEFLLWRDDNYIREYRATQAGVVEQQAELEAQEVVLQQSLATLKTSYDQAMALVESQGGRATGPPIGVTTGLSQAADPVQRNANGSLPLETANQPDPTNLGKYLTPRTLHMLQQARAAGFNNYTLCWQPGIYEHPKGRACDFSVYADNFHNQHPDIDDPEYAYGSAIASWAVDNAEALGVYYVIWYKLIWSPSIGWHIYTGACGNVACDHTNHVHISMY